jgi:hypothetical protein
VLAPKLPTQEIPVKDASQPSALRNSRRRNRSEVVDVTSLASEPRWAMRAPTIALAALLLCSTAFAQNGQAPAGAPPAPQARPQTRPQGGAAPSDDSFRFGSPPALPEGMTEPQIWPAATAEGWAKPVVIKWQRSFDDALKVARARNRPLLVCVNMDGEIASEHFAGVKYRDPAVGELLAPYVCVVASVYRHTPRDYDENGQRVECPRFGTVTCGEHIAAETELYDKYFEGLRVSPRHIALDLSGKELYDVYYSWDTKTVLTAYVEGAKDFPPYQEPVRDGQPLPERVASADIVDRQALEQAYKTGDVVLRRTLLKATAQRREVDHNELLRLAVFGLDVELAKLARQSLAQNQTEGAVDLIAEALKAPMDKDERDMLIAAAERLGEKFPRAKTLATLHKGLAIESKHIDATKARSASAQYEANSRVLTVAAGVEERANSASTRPADADAKLELAEALLARSAQPGVERRFAQTLLEDARLRAEEAEKLGAKGWRLDALLAVTANRLGNQAAALPRAVAAVEGGMLKLDDSGLGATEDVKVQVLAMFALSRQLAIRKAYRERTQWPPEWMADVNAAYATLSEHPLVTDENLVSYYDFLRWLGASPRANGVLDNALKRFPDSALLHERLRSRILWDKGPSGLLSTYSEMLARPEATLQLSWYAGYAALVAAEHHRRRGEFEPARAAYDSGIAHYETNIKALPDGADLCQHFIALALAGRARMALEQGDLERATDELLASFSRRADSAATPDGLNLTPADTARMLEARLTDAKREDLLARLKEALAKLDPKLLELPTSERNVPGRGQRPPRGG